MSAEKPQGCEVLARPGLRRKGLHACCAPAVATRFLTSQFSLLTFCPLLALMLATSLGLAGCRQDMHDQPKAEPLERSDFFPDGRSARPWVVGTIARGQLREDEHLYTGKVHGRHAETFPFPVDARVLERGRERFDIYCSPCHSRLGDGNGMIVQRGFRRPTSFHDERLRKAPPGYFFDVITNGFGTMFDYADRIVPEDRWAIAAYIKALQLSQNTDPQILTTAERVRIDAMAGTPAGEGGPRQGGSTEEGGR